MDLNFKLVDDDQKTQGRLTRLSKERLAPVLVRKEKILNNNKKSYDKPKAMVDNNFIQDVESSSEDEDDDDAEEAVSESSSESDSGTASDSSSRIKKSKLRCKSGNKVKVTAERLSKARDLYLQMSKRNIPFEEAATPLLKASENLHVSAVPDFLPCRDDEFAFVYAQVESAIEEGVGSCLYIAGVPGTGKTATVMSVMRILKDQVKSDNLAPFELVELNGMKLTQPNHAYSSLWFQLTGNHVSPAHAESLLAAHFTTSNDNTRPCVVIIDELDQLVNKKQSVVYNFFDWPHLPNSRLIVIAIANTMGIVF